MPRPRLGLGFALAAVLAAAILGPAAVQTALAAAAGSLFEAAPFVLAASLVPRRLAAFVPLAGCGCAGRLPGALSLPATALCFIAFGPALALGRFALAAVASLAHRNGRSEESEPADRCARPLASPEDPFGMLLRLAPAAALASLVASSLPGLGTILERSGAGRAGSIALGIAFGTLAPCATVGVAVAAVVARHAPFLAAGIVMSTGLISVPRVRLISASMMRRVSRRGLPRYADSRANACTPPPVGTFVNGRIPLLGLSVAMAALTRCGPAGLINPRLLPITAIGAVLALVAAARGVRARPIAFALPLIMGAALVAGSPVPAYTASATDLESAFAGERLTFAGIAHARGGSTVLERFEISCCRADASPVAVRIAGPLRAPDGTWIEATGELERANDGLVLNAKRWRRIPPPRDPFLYR